MSNKPRKQTSFEREFNQLDETLRHCTGTRLKDDFESSARRLLTTAYILEGESELGGQSVDGAIAMGAAETIRNQAHEVVRLYCRSIITLKQIGPDEFVKVEKTVE